MNIPYRNDAFLFDFKTMLTYFMLFIWLFQIIGIACAQDADVSSSYNEGIRGGVSVVAINVHLPLQIPAKDQ